ncbi:MAG TPA: hypothetical protein DCZ01_00105 [Elusimicrobia bacterium]|nr:MAG: hypothetical protein A2X37_03365 [Elusimicrobia bacterium GWA2_66_18]OGR74370.1 MAG: hypothetical protein A2X40_10190 [Elusimicrobia bacterium GWC2_65_9]HAZ06937.1 hypothetical protein [Elusimicrobiota bacterium]
MIFTGFIVSLLLGAPAGALTRVSVKADAVEARLRAADAALDKADYERARDELAAAEYEMDSKDPRIVRVYERRGAAYLREGRIKEARDAFTRAIASASTRKADGPAVSRAYAGMGLCLLKQDNKEFALKFFKRGLAFAPDEGTRMFLEDHIRELEGGEPEPLR